MAVHDYRSLKVPDGTISERRAMVASELIAVLGSKMHDREFDIWDTELPNERDADNVSVVSLSRRWAVQAARDLRRAGLQCEVLDAVPLALGRAVHGDSAGTTGTPIGLVDWGYANTTFCIVVDGRPLFTRRMRDCSFGPVLDAVSEGLGVTSDAAQHLVMRYGLPDSSAEDARHEEIQAVLMEVVRPPLMELVEQFNKTLTYLASQMKSLTPERIWMFGGGAGLPGICEFLSRVISVPISVWLNEQTTDSSTECPAALLATAMALSSLAWTPS